MLGTSRQHGHMLILCQPHVWIGHWPVEKAKKYSDSGSSVRGYSPKVLEC